MTKIERLERELDEAYRQRLAAVKQNNLHWREMAQAKIERLQKELMEAKRYEPMKLKDILDDKGDEVKNKVYKSLLKISLAADFANECVEQTKAYLKELEINNFSLRADVEELCKLSQNVASFVIIPNQNVLTDMMTDNAEFISICDEAADKHLNDKLKL